MNFFHLSNVKKKSILLNLLNRIKRSKRFNKFGYISCFWHLKVLNKYNIWSKKFNNCRKIQYWSKIFNIFGGIISPWCQKVERSKKFNKFGKIDFLWHLQGRRKIKYMVEKMNTSANILNFFLPIFAFFRPLLNFFHKILIYFDLKCKKKYKFTEFVEFFRPFDLLTSGVRLFEYFRPDNYEFFSTTYWFFSTFQMSKKNCFTGFIQFFRPFDLLTSGVRLFQQIYWIFSTITVFLWPLSIFFEHILNIFDLSNVKKNRKFYRIS